MSQDRCPDQSLGPSGQWTVQTHDGIVLLNPEGKPISLAYRKVGELLVRLLCSPGRASPRGDLGSFLWPSSGAAAQATYLRQSILKLRGAIGASNVVADRFECGIAESFSCALDSRSDSDPVPGWLSGWILFLEGLSNSSPEQFFEAIRANVDLLGDLPTPQLSALVARASVELPYRHRMDGWRHFVLGSVSLGEVPIASRHFLAAAKHASAALDHNLFNRSAFWLSACQILLGQVERADGLATEALTHGAGQTAAGSSYPFVTRATASLHMGRFAESREMMVNVCGHGGTTVFEHDQHEALRAFYLATTGYEDEAMRLIETLPKSSLHPSGRVQILTDLTNAAVESVAAPWIVVNTMEKRIQTLEAAGQHHFALYAIESLAAALARCNLKQEARTKIRESRRIRSRLGIAYSAWDARRLAPFVVS